MTTLQAATDLAYARQGRASREVERGTPGLVARIASDRKTREDAFALRHLSYLADGHIDPKPTGLFSDPFDDEPNCETIVLYKARRPVASVRVCVADIEEDPSIASQIPAGQVFPKEIERLVAESSDPPVRRVIEINRLVRHPDHETDHGLVFVLFRLAGYMIVHYDVDLVLSCVRRNHLPFYRRLRFQPIAGPRTYHGVKFASHLMGCFRPAFDNVRRLLDVSEGVERSYDALLDGKAIPVFGVE